MEPIELAKKLKALADRGVDGEQINAQKMLQSFLEKHNLTEQDVLEEKVIKEVLPYNTKWEKKLACQIIYTILGPEGKMYKHSGKHAIWTECTVPEAAQIKLFYEHYLELFRKEQAVFYTAFLSQNRLFPEDEPAQEREFTQEELDHFRRARLMASSIMNTTPFKRID